MENRSLTSRISSTKTAIDIAAEDLAKKIFIQRLSQGSETGQLPMLNTKEAFITPLILKKRKMRIPKRISNELKTPPHRTGGLHKWIFVMALKLLRYRSPEEAIRLIDGATASEAVRSGEIEEAVQNAANGGSRKASTGAIIQSRPPRFPTVNQVLRRDIIVRGGGLADLCEASPIRFLDDEPHTNEIIDALFPAESLLCCGISSSRFDTKERSKWRDLSSLQLIVPNPMSSLKGLTKAGKQSAHTLDNTGPRRFLIVEQDSGNTDEQSSIMLHLAEKAPLALAVHSGSKSIHGWFYCGDESEERLRSFMNYAVSLGADQATWTRSQFVRMPGGLRDNGNRQSIYFFNPSVTL